MRDKEMKCRRGRGREQGGSYQSERGERERERGREVYYHCFSSSSSPLHCYIRAKEISSRNIPLAFIAKEHSLAGAKFADSSASQGFLSCDQISDLLGNSGFRLSRQEIELLAAGI